VLWEGSWSGKATEKRGGRSKDDGVNDPMQERWTSRHTSCRVSVGSEAMSETCKGGPSRKLLWASVERTHFHFVMTWCGPPISIGGVGKGMVPTNVKSQRRIPLGVLCALVGERALSVFPVLAYYPCVWRPSMPVGKSKTRHKTWQAGYSASRSSQQSGWRLLTFSNAHIHYGNMRTKHSCGRRTGLTPPANHHTAGE
jgi:hypothetical protein